MAWKVTVRRGSKVEVERHETLGAALDAMEARVRELRPEARKGPRKVLGRDYAAQDLVGVRVEVAGPQRLLPRTHAGVDVRGDGSELAWTGRINKNPVDTARGESGVDALRRVLAA